MKRDRRHIAAFAATVAIHAAVVGTLLVIGLTYDSTGEQQRTWPPVDSSEILFGGDYVIAGDLDATDTDEPATTPQSQPTEAAAETAFESVDPPVEAVETGQTETAHRELMEREQREREAINARMHFGAGNGRKGNTDGNSTDGAVDGVTASGLGNRRALELPSPPRGPLGKVTVRISVDRAGRVSSARYVNGSGAAGASSKARSECIEAAKASRFSAAPEAPATQTGTLTYVYK